MLVSRQLVDRYFSLVVRLTIGLFRNTRRKQKIKAEKAGTFVDRIFRAVINVTLSASLDIISPFIRVITYHVYH